MFSSFFTPFLFVDSLSFDTPETPTFRASNKASEDRVVVRIKDPKKKVNYTKVGFL
jgi:hypothetical protein